MFLLFGFAVILLIIATITYPIIFLFRIFGKKITYDKWVDLFMNIFND